MYALTKTEPKAITIGEIRKKNLRRLIDENYEGVLNRLAKAANIAHSQLWRVLKDPPVKGQPRYVGEKLARRLEEVSGLPRGWLDRRDYDHIIDDFIDEAGALALQIRQLSDEDQAVIQRLVHGLEVAAEMKDIRL